LTKLEKLNIQQNQFSGSLPPELISKWTKLTIASMGNNFITGSIPSEMLTNWSSIKTIGLENNLMTGTLPEIVLSSSTSTLEKISIEKNLFTGTIPISYGNYMIKLSSFSLQENGITGIMPSNLCPISNINVMEDIKADCNEIICDCCTECFIDPATDPKRDTKNTVIDTTIAVVDTTIAAVDEASSVARTTTTEGGGSSNRRRGRLLRTR